MKFFLLLWFLAMCTKVVGQPTREQVYNSIIATGISCENSDRAVALIRQVQFYIGQDNEYSALYLPALFLDPRCQILKTGLRVALALVDYSDVEVQDELFSIIASNLPHSTQQMAFTKLMDLVLADPCSPNLNIFDNTRQAKIYTKLLNCENSGDELTYTTRCPVGSPNHKRISKVYLNIHRLYYLEPALKMSDGARFKIWEKEVLSNRFYVSPHTGMKIYDHPWYVFNYLGWKLTITNLIDLEIFLSKHQITDGVFNDVIQNIIKPSENYYGSPAPFGHVNLTDWTSRENINLELMAGRSQILSYIRDDLQSDAMRARCYKIIDILISNYLDQVISAEVTRGTTFFSYHILVVGNFLAFNNYPHTVAKRTFGSKISHYFQHMVARGRAHHRQDFENIINLLNQ